MEQKRAYVGPRTEPENMPCGGHNVKHQNSWGGNVNKGIIFKNYRVFFLKKIGGPCTPAFPWSICGAIFTSIFLRKLSYQESVVTSSDWGFSWDTIKKMKQKINNFVNN